MVKTSLKCHWFLILLKRWIFTQTSRVWPRTHMATKYCQQGSSRKVINLTAYLGKSLSFFSCWIITQAFYTLRVSTRINYCLRKNWLSLSPLGIACSQNTISGGHSLAFSAGIWICAGIYVRWLEPRFRYTLWNDVSSKTTGKLPSGAAGPDPLQFLKK